MKPIYCPSCDRLNGKKARFCGSCGQAITAVGVHVERLSFPLWSIVLLLCIGFMPATLYFLSLSYTYWVATADASITQSAALSFTICLFGALLFYSALYTFVLSQFRQRASVRLFRAFHLICACIGIVLSSYMLLHALRGGTALIVAAHDVLQAATNDQLQHIFYKTITHYIAFLAFYIIIFASSLRMHIDDKKWRQKQAHA